MAVCEAYGKHPQDTSKEAHLSLQLLTVPRSIEPTLTGKNDFSWPPPELLFPGTSPHSLSSFQTKQHPLKVQFNLSLGPPDLQYGLFLIGFHVYTVSPHTQTVSRHCCPSLSPYSCPWPPTMVSSVLWTNCQVLWICNVCYSLTMFLYIPHLRDCSVSVSSWLTSLSIMLSTSIHARANDTIYFFS